MPTITASLIAIAVAVIVMLPPSLSLARPDNNTALSSVVKVSPANVLPMTPTTLVAAPTDVFISEYIEGSSNNKAIEIYNGTGAAINLATGTYQLEYYFNGSATAGLTIALTGSVANGDVYVVAQASANATILAQADQTNGAGWFNGDDAIILRKGGSGGSIVDSVGQVGNDPGTEWGTGLTSTADNTLQRKSTVCAGDTNASDTFDPSIEWNGFAVDTFTGLGAHTASCGDSAPSVSSTTPTDNATGVALGSNIDVTFSEAVTASSAAFSISCATSGAHTFALSGGPTTFTLNPDSDFVNSEVCTVTVDDVQVTDQDTDDPPDNMTADYVFDFTTVSATPTLSISDVTQEEGSGGGTTAFTFTVSLSTSTHGGVTFDIASADGTAQDGNPGGEDTDYTANTLTSQTIPNGSDSYQFTVNVNADTTVEPDENFFVNVTNVTGASVTDGQGQATITNDDFTITPIHDIQGNGDSSPLTGQTLTTTGIVTLLKTGQNVGAASVPNGFFLQAPEASYDADPNTSEGIFVFTSSVPTAAVGDEVRVSGTVAEFNGLSEISSVTNVTIIDTGNTLPIAVTLDAAILDPTALPTQPQLEKYESMRLSGASLLSVAPNDNFFDVYVVLSSVPRPMREAGIPYSDPIPPDPTSGTPDCCIPIWDENPERLKLDTNGRSGAPNNPYTSNVTFTSVTGPLDYAFGEYRLIPDAAPTASSNMTAVAAPTPLASEFTIASFNIENFNNNATQRQKAADTIRNILHFPDIIGTVEIFDLADLQALRDQINNDAVANSQPNPMYEAYLVEQDGTSGDNDQDVGFLVKTARVQVNSVTQEREEETYAEPGGDPAAILHDRPPLVLDSIVDPSGTNPRRVLVVVNHLRSFIDIELVAGDGPRVREKRKKQAESLADLLNDLQTANPGVPVISVGDYNAYQFNSGYDDSLSVIKGNPTADDQIVVDQSPDLVNPNLTNLIDTLSATEQYSFIFEGTPQALDHHVVNQAALARNTRLAIARVNADFPENPSATYANNAATPERNSDHDPVVSYYSLNEGQTAGSVIISEFRFRGPGPSVTTAAAKEKIGKSGTPSPNSIVASPEEQDEFVELYNNTDSDITVATTDASAGWTLVASTGNQLCMIENGTILRARHHYLCVNLGGYSLISYANPDNFFVGDIPDGGGIALFRTNNPVNYTLAERLDAAGYAGVDSLYREGAGFPTGGGEMAGTPEYSFFRTMTRATGGLPKDTGDNLADFKGVSTDGIATGAGQNLGAPGPESSFSPINRNSQFGFDLLDTGASANSTPNRERDFTPVTNGNFGTLILRRKFTNNTGEPVTQLRFRIVETTTFPTPLGSGLADLRALTTADEPSITTTGGSVYVFGTTVEEPPDQPLGGAWNTSLNVPGVSGGLPTSPAGKVRFTTPTNGTISLNAPLENAQSINVKFLLGVVQPGTFTFFLNVEANTGCSLVVLQPCEINAAPPKRKR